MNEVDSVLLISKEKRKEKRNLIKLSRGYSNSINLSWIDWRHYFLGPGNSLPAAWDNGLTCSTKENQMVPGCVRVRSIWSWLSLRWK